MFNEKPLCTECKREIEDGEIVHIKMRYPKRRGVTEIKAYLKNEAQFTCQTCFENQ